MSLSAFVYFFIFLRHLGSYYLDHFGNITTGHFHLFLTPALSITNTNLEYEIVDPHMH